MSTFAAIVPIFNGADYIDECLLSILNQSRPPDEIILVNDGSNDETQAKIDEWCRRNVDIKYSLVPKIGVSGARNHGASLAKSDNLMFLDVDDRWLPDKIHVHEKHLIQHPDCKFSFSLTQTIDSKSKLMIKRDYPQLTEPNFFNVIMHAYQIQGSSSSVCIERGLFNSLGGFQSGLTRGEDWEFWVRCAQELQPCEINEVLVSIYLRPNSVEQTPLSGVQNFYSTRLHLMVWSKYLDYLNEVDFPKFASKILFADILKNRYKILTSYTGYTKLFKELGLTILPLLGINKANIMPIRITLLYIRFRGK